LVCLATPFLIFRPRRYLLNLRLLVFTAIAYLLLMLMLIVAGKSPESQRSQSLATKLEQTNTVATQNPETPRPETLSFAGLLVGTYPGITARFGAVGAMIFLALCSAAAGWGSMRLTQRAARSINRLQERAGERYRTPKKVSFRLLGVSLPWDEARVWLRALWRLAEVPFWLNPILIWFYGLGLLAMLFLELPESLAALNLERSPSAWIWCVFWDGLFIIVIVAFWAVASQAAMLLSVFIRGHPLGYGWDGYATAWVGRITAQEQPPLPASQYTTLKVKEADITAEIGQAKTWSKLRHSLLYESPTVVRGIAEWMKQQIEYPLVETQSLPSR
jgi:hypothetical protein